MSGRRSAGRGGFARADGGQPLPFRTINHLSEGDTLRYAPILRGKEKRPGEVALVLVPEKRQPGGEDIVVTDPKPADKPQEWTMTQTISVAALVYGPAGLSRKKVARFLSQDEVLIAQLADYADKTAQAEQLVATLSNSESSSASVNAALKWLRFRVWIRRADRQECSACGSGPDRVRNHEPATGQLQSAG